MYARRESFKGSRKGTKAIKIWSNDDNLRKLMDEVRCGVYTTDTPNHFIRFDKYSHKLRIIDAPTMKDKIVQHALIQAMENRLRHTLISHTLASLPNKGIEYGRKLVEHWAHVGGKNVKYVVKWDIRHFYDEVQIRYLTEWFGKRIRDKQVLALLIQMFYGKSKGLILGSYVSQWCANIMLSPIDHWVKEDSHVKFYMRYADDSIAFFSRLKDAKRFAETIQTRTTLYLSLEVKTEGKGALKIWRWSDYPIDMIGYRMYRNGYQELRGSQYLSLTRLMHRIELNGASKKQALSLISKKGFVKHSSCSKLRESVYNMINKSHIKEIAYESYYAFRRVS